MGDAFRMAILISAMRSASHTRSAQVPVSPAAVGRKPAGAVTDGRASMPAPTVLPVIRAMAPNSVPLFFEYSAASIISWSSCLLEAVHCVREKTDLLLLAIVHHCFW